MRKVVLTFLVMCVITPVLLYADMGPFWVQYERVADAGWSSESLGEARALAEEIGSAAVMVIHQGKVVVAWGNLERKFRLHSARKSVLAALYGTRLRADSRELRLTLGELGIKKRQDLTSAEKKATLADLLASRSGVYLTAARETGGWAEKRPARGSNLPGAAWYYNNWDFNVLGDLYTSLFHQGLFEDFSRRLAAPIQMQDFRSEDGSFEMEPSKSLYPAYEFRMSTRDLARIGQLYLQNGFWNGKTVIDPSWIQACWTPRTKFNEKSGYGYLWWIDPTDSLFSTGEPLPVLDKFQDFAAIGAGGHLLLIIPELEIVIVHRGDTDNNRDISDKSVFQLAERLLGARVGRATKQAPTVGLKSVPFANELPAPVYPRAIPIAQEQLDSLPGNYQVQGGPILRVTAFEKRLFILHPEKGEIELYCESGNKFFAATRGIQVEFLPPKSVVVRMQGRELKAERIP